MMPIIYLHILIFAHPRPYLFAYLLIKSLIIPLSVLGCMAVSVCQTVDGLFPVQHRSKMISQFVEQVQILMHTQQIKCAESVFGKSNYMWLCSKRTPFIWMSTNDECLLRQALTKVSPDQQVKVMKQLLTWLDSHPEVHCLKIPEMSLRFLNNVVNANLMSELNFSRMNSFRNSLRRFSLMRNKVTPAATIDIPDIGIRRSVTFNEVPTVYRISNK